ncbi:MAG: hypothetical protein HQM08_05240 [Candidatus Riflebacteria bacterium]|nr:hypothetical protein [Candidatus Riflebacteria bacterium]
MLRKIIVSFILLCSFVSIVFSENPQDYENNLLSNDFRQKAFRGEETLKLYVPKSFEGRSGKESRKTIGAELFDGFRIERIESNINLKGLSSVFGFGYVKDRYDYQIFRSKAQRPGDQSCRECHACNRPRTTIFFGNESELMEAEPLVRGSARIRLGDVSQKSWHGKTSYWITSKYMTVLDFSSGSLIGSGLSLKTSASTIELSGTEGHSFAWKTMFSISKVESYPEKKYFQANLVFKLSRRMKFQFGGGIFLDGISYFGTDMSELGGMIFGLEKSDPNLLPSLYEKLRKEKFGFYKSSIVYEYPF